MSVYCSDFLFSDTFWSIHDAIISFFFCISKRVNSFQKMYRLQWCYYFNLKNFSIIFKTKFLQPAGSVTSCLFLRQSRTLKLPVRELDLAWQFNSLVAQRAFIKISKKDDCSSLKSEIWNKSLLETFTRHSKQIELT